MKSNDIVPLTYQDREIRQGLFARLEALLAYLLHHQDSPIPRQRLAFLFWPDTSEKQAHANLRNLLYKLRVVLPEAGDYLSIDQNTLQWKSEKMFSLDVDNFSHLARQSTSIEPLKAAIQIYSGDLLPDLYDDWIQDPRECLRQRYLTVLENLIALLEKERYLQEALHYTRLLAACEAVKERFSEGYLFYNPSTYDRVVEMLPNHLDEGTFTATWTLGRLMSLEQAVSYALKKHFV